MQPKAAAGRRKKKAAAPMPPPMPGRRGMKAAPPMTAKAARMKRRGRAITDAKRAMGDLTF